MAIHERQFRIIVRKHAPTGLLVAISPDHKGLNVFGRTDDDIRRLIPDALRALLESEGGHVIQVTAEHETADINGFDNPSFMAEARFAA